MSFHEKLRKPSFRGFEFSLVNESNDFGRDVKAQKPINAKKVYYEDVGVKEDIFTLEIVIGGTDDFVEQAKQFKAILSEKGSGRLVLPHEGEMLAVVLSARQRTDSNEVGIVYFSVTFGRDESVKQQSGISTSFALKNSSDSALDNALIDFLAVYNDNAPDFVLDSTLAQINDYTSNMVSILNRAKVNFTAPEFSVYKAETFGQQIISMFESLISYEDVVDYTVSTSSPIYVEERPDPLLLVNTLSGLTGQVKTDFTANTTTQSLRAVNNAATDLLTKISAASAAAKAVSYASFPSKKEAIDVRSNLLNTMATLRTTAGAQRWSNSYTSLGGLMAAVNNDINTGLGRLPDTVTIRNQFVRPSLALAYRIYGDDPTRVVAKASDLVARNAVVHPCFVPAEDMEVIIND